jgi:hypothetical protein
MRFGVIATLSWCVLIAGGGHALPQELSPRPPDAIPGLAIPVKSDAPVAALSGADDRDGGTISASAPCGPPGKIWGDAEVLLWWMRGTNVPPLLSVSPPGTPRAAVGVLGAPGTTVAFGGDQPNQDLRVGGRVTAGMWLNCEQSAGLEAYYFQLNTQASGTAAGSPALVGRPFFDAATGRPNAELVSFPGLVNGNAQASVSSGGLLGAGLLGRCNLCCACNYRLDLLAGYRFLYLTDRIGINEDLTSTDVTQAAAPLGTRILLTDRFSTRNTFHGFDGGLAGEYRWGNWLVQGKATVALGDSREVADISGFTTVASPGLPATTMPGGFLALTSNMGRHSRDAIAFVPEIDARIGYQLTPGLRLYASYTFLYWSQVLRAGEQIDTAVNPGLLPPPLAGATPLRPAFTFNGTGAWVQGVSLGLELRY